MKLATIKIKNFKSLRDAEFEPTDFGCLVGENNAGKSSILQAITYALRRPPNLAQELFYDANAAVEFALHFTNILADDLRRLAEEHRTKLEPLVTDGKLAIIVRYRVAQKIAITIGTKLPTEPRYRDDAISAVFAGKRGAAVRTALADTYPEFANEAPDPLNISQAKEFLAGKIALLPANEFEDGEVPLPSGISGSITDLLPEPIYIPAVKDVGDDLKTSQSTSFGRLLGLLLDDMMPDLALVRQALDELDRLFNRTTNDGVQHDQRHQKVKDLEGLIEGFLSANFPAVKLELKVPPPELRTILNSAQLFVDDGARDLIDNKGDGIKRTMTFALLQAYVHRQAAQAQNNEGTLTPRPLIFLFEEPELYLHPKSQRILFDTLSKISATHQVVVTTHSPLFFAPGVTAAFVRVAKQVADPKPIGSLHKVNFKLDVESAEVFRLARFDNADAAFFSRRVVLFEGESDDSYCKHVAKLINQNWDFDKHNIALVRVSGKGNFARYRKFFEAFGIEVKIIADLDALFDGYEHLGTCVAANALRGPMIQGVDARIAALGTKAEPSSRQIKDRIGQDSWRQRYEAARTALRAVQDSGELADDTLEVIDRLFVWEDAVARVKVCREDVEAKALLLPSLDALRASGICILSKGAIEDYYPNDAPSNGPKPDRALAAARMVTTENQARGLSQPLAENRSPELCEVFAHIFGE